MNELVQYELFSWTSSLLNYKELDLQLTQHQLVFRGEVSNDSLFCDIYASLLSGARCSSVFITYCIYMYRTCKCMSSINHSHATKATKGVYFFLSKSSYRSKCRQLEASPSPFCSWGWVVIRILWRFNNLSVRRYPISIQFKRRDWESTLNPPPPTSPDPCSTSRA